MRTDLPSLFFRLSSTPRETTNAIVAIRYVVQKSNSCSRKVAGMTESDAMFVNL